MFQCKKVHVVCKNIAAIKYSQGDQIFEAPHHEEEEKKILHRQLCPLYWELIPFSTLSWQWLNRLS